MPDENRVFDVTKPKHVSPTATSKPIIVGHQPMISDPMVNKEEKPDAEESKSTKIEIKDGIVQPAAVSPVSETPSDPEADSGSAFKITQPEETNGSLPPITTEVSELSTTSTEPPPDEKPELSSLPDEAPTEQPHIEGLNFTAAKRKRGGLKFIILGLVILLIGLYLAADAGAFGNSINMPFHIFKMKTASVTIAPNPSPPAAATTTTSLPSGFKEYKLSTTNITFAAPTAWGDPSSVTEQGYSTKRGGTNQPDGAYAYVVSFSANKDVQIAVTSNKYLPPSRDRLYYDFLQWCTGSSDGKYYASVLNFTTADKIDTPTTVTCDQGPLNSATKLDTATIVQTKITAASGSTLGDIYTKNLTGSSDLVVFRVKDTPMTNSADIKKLLGTIKSSTSATGHGGQCDDTAYYQAHAQQCSVE